MNDTTSAKEFWDAIDCLENTFAELAKRFDFAIGSFSYDTAGSNHITLHSVTIAPAETPPASPEQFIEQQKQRIVQQQRTQRKDRIKPWDDKGKRFK